MEIVVRTIAIILSLVGTFFFLVGTIGLLRLPDFYSRCHATTKCDTLGAIAILIGLAVYTKFSVEAVKVLIICLLVLVTSPTMGHTIARAAYRRGLPPWRKKPV